MKHEQLRRQGRPRGRATISATVAARITELHAQGFSSLPETVGNPVAGRISAGCRSKRLKVTAIEAIEHIAREGAPGWGRGRRMPP